MQAHTSSVIVFSNSNDDCCDSALTLLALHVIEEWSSEYGLLCMFCLHILNNTSAHFKNRFQAYDACTYLCVRRWVYSSLGCGKSMCSNAGGLGKHMAVTHNLHAPVNNLVRSAQTFIEWLCATVPSVIPLHLSRGQLLKFKRKKQKGRMHMPACHKISRCLERGQNNESASIVLRRCAAGWCCLHHVMVLSSSSCV